LLIPTSTTTPTTPTTPIQAPPPRTTTTPTPSKAAATTATGVFVEKTEVQNRLIVVATFASNLNDQPFLGRKRKRRQLIFFDTNPQKKVCLFLYSGNAR